MLALPGVTLCCLDTANHALALRALERSMRGVAFGAVRFLTHALPGGLDVPAGVEIVDVGPIASRDAYSQFVLKSLGPHVATAHALLVQWDGYVIHPEVWDDAFLQCDYLGAKWYWYEDGLRVGNGGFSLRSRRLLDALADRRVVLTEAEDLTIGRTFRPLLEREHGIVFGSEALADRFSFEVAYPTGPTFGFHGLFNFCRTVPEQEIAAMAPGFSDGIARSPQLMQLLRNCIALGQWTAAAAIGERIVRAQPDATEAAALLERARVQAARPPVVGRNAPCPCGSGRRYRECHGALDRSRDTAAPAAGGAAPVAAGAGPSLHAGDAASAPAAAAQAPSGGSSPAAGDAPAVDVALREALAAHQRGALDAAEATYRRVLAQAPGHPVATHFLGVAAYQRGRLDAALPLLQQAAAAMPQEAEFHNNLGVALTAADRFDEAVTALRRALERKPDHAGAWNNLGLALQQQNRLDEAIAAFRRALALQPAFAHAQWNLSLALLLDRRFDEGWQAYEARLALQELGQRVPMPATPRWQGDAQPGKSLLLLAEQGLGDALQFARLARRAADMGWRVTVRSSAALHALLESVPGIAAVADAAAPFPRHDVHLPLLSLPRVLHLGAQAMGDAVPYVAASSALRREARAALDALPHARPGALRVGLAWAGSAHNANDRRRSLRPAEAAPLFAMPGVTWVSLQKEAADPALAPSLVELPLRLSLDGTAAMIAELDLVVSVDTSLAHLTGALGRPLVVMLPFAPDWRWQLGRDDSPWYPTARLVRQPRPGDWTSAMAQVGAILAQHARALAPSGPVADVGAW